MFKVNTPKENKPVQPPRQTLGDFLQEKDWLLKGRCTTFCQEMSFEQRECGNVADKYTNDEKPFKEAEKEE